MNYIVYDLEFNHEHHEKNENIIPSKCPFEIIQIGALKLDENFNTIESFNKLVKPKLYTTLHPYVQSLTNITTEMLVNAPSFKDVYKDFSHFIGGDKNVLCVWGVTDIKELIRNVEFHDLNTSIIPKQYINIQQYASKYLKYSKGSSIGLKNAVELFNIPINLDFHDAFNDAYYTCEIFKNIYTPEMKPVSYITNKYGRERKVKAKFDSISLINQFEKMFNRKMTPEEKSIIRLAYMMGRTNQFQIYECKKTDTE